MKKRLWLKIAGFSVDKIFPPHLTDDRAGVWVDMRLGELFKIRSVLITKHFLNGNLEQNWDKSGIYFRDTPGAHRSSRTRNPLLSEVFELMLINDCWDKFYRAFDGGFDMNPYYIQPKTWEGKSLRIPVDFIRFQHLNRSSEGLGVGVWADFVVGHHLMVCGVPVYDGSEFAFDPDKTKVLSEELRALAERLLKNKALRKCVKNISRHDAFEWKTNFTSVLAKGCKTGGTPPLIRFY